MVGVALERGRHHLLQFLLDIERHLAGRDPGAVADPEDVDKAMKLGARHPMGPLQLVDMIGLDIHRAKMQTLRKELDDPRYNHPPIVDKLIEDGNLGKKTGKGFYTYGG